MKKNVSHSDSQIAGKSESVKQASRETILQAYRQGTVQLKSAEPVERQENKTGLPDNLKSGVENLSGHSLDDVKVHYNSSQPASLQAHAYAQGTDIHVAPGQEKHLPHETWHVVQQKQGRVQPTRQLKGATNINDDQSLEKEADVMGLQALNLSIAKNQSLSEVNPGNTIQRKIKINEALKSDNQVYTHLDDEDVDLKTAFEKEILTKPKAVIKKAADNGAVLSDFGDEGKDKARIKSWNDEDTAYNYSETKADAEEIAKDTIKYYLYKKFEWLNIGVAAYMTGDVTGLLMATSLKDNVSLEVLKGKKENDEEESDWVAPENYKIGEDEIFAGSTTSMEGVPVKDLMLHVNEAMAKKRGKKVSIPNFYTKGGVDEEPALPETFKHESLKSKVNESDAAKEGYEGTRDAYKKKFDQHSGTAIKPWNKETYEATKMIGELYPGKKKEIESMLLPENPEKAILKKIDTYREGKVGSSGIILMWGRLSGLAGGAHNELDSHPVTMVQIAKKIAADFPSRTIVLIGDKVVSESILRKAGIRSTIVDINTFWSDAYFKDNAIPMGDRRYQHYLVQQMSKVNDAVSIGMRSGSLEATALLGVKTIFLDNEGNNAAERMEFWAGSGAKDRDVSAGDWEKTENAKAGPVKNYKRVATKKTTGDKIYSAEMKSLLDTLAKIEAVPAEKITATAKIDAPKSNARIEKFADKIKTIKEIKILSNEMGTLYQDVINSPSIKTGKDTNEVVKLDAQLLGKIKTESELRLKDMDQLNVGISGKEADQISKLTGHLIKQDLKVTASELENLEPKEMHEAWTKLTPIRKTNIRNEIIYRAEKYPRIKRNIFEQAPRYGRRRPDKTN